MSENKAADIEREGREVVREIARSRLAAVLNLPEADAPTWNYGPFEEKLKACAEAYSQNNQTESEG